MNARKWSGWKRAAIIGGLALVVAGVALGRGGVVSHAASATAVSPPAAGIPRLVDLGAGKCIPCKAMAPILEELRTEYAGRFDVRFIDVWQDPGAAEPYRIQVIPTQIFYAADGRELARHEGFMAKEEILAQWKALGVTF